MFDFTVALLIMALIAAGMGFVCLAVSIVEFATFWLLLSTLLIVVTATISYFGRPTL